jgi:hypothetical protein
MVVAAMQFKTMRKRYMAGALVIARLSCGGRVRLGGGELVEELEWRACVLDEWKERVVNASPSGGGQADDATV